ncbi:MAG TPA: carboxypeptidase regulatory-like domain-containing protein [Vicinamibacterales bacterium]|jgi:hypothetical protein|nr:carboxypeptidase regulatory-like domain-containing protein [Vicinamibacterales bacterium]
MRTRGIRAGLLCAVMLAVWALPAHAQASGSIFGKVTDPSGGVLPGVTVTVTGPSLQQPLTAVTSTSGTYQFTTVPIGTYTVAFELAGFKKAVRPNVVISTGFNAGVDQKLEIGQLSEEVTISAEAPVVDVKKTTTGATFTAQVLENIPSARDPWQIINMTPGVQAGLNVGGSSSGQQVSLASRGTGANVQWNLEGGAITDLSSNSSPSYFNFDAFQEIQVTNGGGDVSVQSSGLSINLVTKSGSNVFKGSAHTTFENDSMQGNNVSQDLFKAGANGFLSGNPIKRISVYDIDYGGPILKNRLWFWGAADKQDINVGITNFFDPNNGSLCGDLVAAQKAGTLSSAITYDNLGAVQKCLANDKTVIKDLQWKINYQLNTKNRFQYSFVSDNKYRNHRGADSTHPTETTYQQTSDAPWKLPLPTHQLLHTLILSDKLVFNNMFTYVGGGFFLDYQDVPPQGNCLQSRYLGGESFKDYQVGTRADASCMWNTQSLLNDTTGVNGRSASSTYQTVRHSWDIKTDGTYFLTHVLGGDHSLKFGLGYRKNPILSFSHYSGGAQAVVQCIDGDPALCGNGQGVAPGSAAGLIPLEADLYRDQLRNNSWWSYNGYLQDSYSHGRLRLNGGVRYDWQQSKLLGGCVPSNQLDPISLPAQCESATETDPVSGKKLQSFSNWSPRVSATYDLFGNGKTQIHASGSYYYDTKITLANALTGLFTQTVVYWQDCESTPTSCWNDANHDLVIQPTELIGQGTSASTRFVNGVLAPAGNIVDPSAQLGRTREAVTGIQHELIPNFAVGVDYIYRKYDRGTATYPIGYQPGGPNAPLSALYVPQTWTDPISGKSATYYTVCQGCRRPSGGSIAVTNPNYSVYNGVDITATKRYSNQWQMQVALTLQKLVPHTVYTTNPTGLDYTDGISTLASYVFKAQGSYTFKWNITAAANFNMNQGDTRTLIIPGPGSVYGGTSGTIRYDFNSSNRNTLRFEPADSVRYDPVKLLDLSLAKAFEFRGGKNRVKVMLDGFNMFNDNTVLAYGSPNITKIGYTQPTTIVAPRVFRLGLAVNF